MNLKKLKYLFLNLKFNQVLEGAPLDKGNLDYTQFTKIIKRGKQDDE